MIYLWISWGWIVLIIVILVIWNLALKYGRRGPGWDDDRGGADVLKATATINGRQTLILGLSFGNLDRFRSEAGDTYIKVDGRDVGLPIDVLIISGETEEKMAELLADGIGPDTKINISARSANQE